MRLSAALLWIAFPALGAVSRVVVVGPHPAHPAVVRSLQELRLLGYQAEYAPDATATLPALMAEHDADAVLAVDDESGAIRFATKVRRHAGQADPVTTVIRPAEDGEPMEVLALRTVELIHGRLAYSSAEPVADVDTSLQPAHAAGEPPSRVQLLIAPGLLVTSGDLPPSGMLHARVQWSPLSHFAVAAWGMLGTTAAERVGELEFEARPSLWGLQARMFDALSEHLELGAGAGVGLLRWRYETAAAAPVFEETTGSRLAALPELSVDAIYLPRPMLGLRASALVGLALPKSSVGVRVTPADTPDPATRNVDFGRWLLALSLGIELRF